MGNAFCLPLALGRVQDHVVLPIGQSHEVDLDVGDDQSALGVLQQRPNAHDGSAVILVEAISRTRIIIRSGTWNSEMVSIAAAGAASGCGTPGGRQKPSRPSARESSFFPIFS